METVDYTEVYFTNKQHDKLVARLKAKNFSRRSICPWSEVWANVETEETVTLVRG